MAQIVEFRSNGHMASGYLATPSNGKGPGVLVIQEWWGLDAGIKEMADRLAAAGFVALAPDLYHGEVAGHDEMDKAAHLMQSLPPDRAAKDMSGAVDYLAGHASVVGSGVGVVGFCMGGMLSFLIAANRPDKVKAVVPFYGFPQGAAEPDWTALAAKVSGHMAEHDDFFPPTAAKALEAKLRGLGKDVTLTVHPGTGHAFMGPHNALGTLNDALAKTIWPQATGFLAAALASPSNPARQRATQSDDGAKRLVRPLEETTMFGILRHGLSGTRATRLLLVTAVLIAMAHPGAVSDGLVISQVYGGGGNAGAPFTNDFVEIHNRSGVALSLNGMSLQYGSATGTGNIGANTSQSATLPNLDVAPGGYVLIQLAGGATGVALPTPDYVDADAPINMSATGGKVVLVTGTTGLGCNGGSTPCSPAQLARIVDLVGYGSANFFEGAPAPAPSATTAVVRAAGNVDTDNNAADFVLAAPAPRNGAASGGAPLLSIDDVTSSEGDGVTSMRFTVSLSRAAAAPVFYDIATRDESATQGADYIALALVGQSIPAGARTATHEVTVLGDTTPEPSESFAITVSNLVGAGAGDLVGRGTLTNDDIPETPIYELQSAGDASPFVGQDVATRGVVTARKVNGFFLQTPDGAADASSDTSNAIFVFTNTTPAVAVGDEVRVTGRMAEFRNTGAATTGTLTEIIGPQVDVVATGSPLPAAVDLAALLAPTAPVPSRSAQLERFEGMLVSAASMDVVGPTNTFGELFAVPSASARPFREPGIDLGEALPVEAPPTVPRFDGNLERIVLDTDDLVNEAGVRRPRLDLPAGTPTAPVRVTPVQGPLDYAFDAYRVAVDGTATSLGSRLPAPVPAPLASEFTVASLNLENFRDGTPNFPQRQQKAAALIVNVLRTPDVLGLIEVGDLDDLRALAGLVNAMAGTTYAAYLEDGDGQTTGFEQNIGYLVNDGRVEVVATRQEFARKTFEFAGQTDLLHDRPPFVLDARVRHTDTPVTVVLNHLRSLIDVNSTAPFGASGLTVGARVREKRRLQAEDVADLVASLPSQNVIVMGDLNAFEFNDGLVDVVNTIAGSPAAADLVTTPSVDRWSHELVNLATGIPPEERYSYVFEGNAQVLDHVLVSPPLRRRLTRFLYARNNADFPESFETDFAVSTRLSDHDAAVAYFSAETDLRVGVVGAVASEVGAPIPWLVEVSNDGDTAADARLEIAVPAGLTLQPVGSVAGWTCAAETGALVCLAPTVAGHTTSTLGFTVQGSCDLPPGSVRTLTATLTSTTAEPNTSDNTATSTATFSNSGPTIQDLAVDRTELPWQSYALTPVTVGYHAVDSCGPVTTAVRVESNEAVTGVGQGVAGLTSPDWDVVDAHTVALRAERSVRGTGRIYSIIVTATDTAGGTDKRVVYVTVPR